MEHKAKSQMRVFLSSTFVDMQKERDYLVKKIFPSIKAECRRRGVDFVALDLRWGISEETARSGKVVEICMDEIVRSRPFFIGLLGGRYGWIPQEGDDAITEKLLARYPWVQDSVSKGLSITEMEMQFGVLANPELINAFFFQKDEIAIPRKFRDKRGTEASEKLARLKSAVRQAADEGRCTLGSYSSLKALGRQVHDALMEKIDELYPEESNSRFARYSRNQHDFLQRRRHIYVRYEAAMELKGKVLVHGEGGMGKSSFIANHAADGLKEGCRLVYTVVNSDVNSAEMCRRMLIYELSCQIPGMDASVLDQPLEQSVDLAEIFDKAGFAGQVRWVIDGIDKLALPHERAATWIDSLPSQVSEVVMTASSVDEISSVVSQSFLKIEVKPLSAGEIMEITKKYLEGFAKALSGIQESHISNSVLLKNPETLMVFLEELLQFGVHEKLGEFVEGYLSARDVEEFYVRVLERLDKDFGFKRMQDVFSWIIMCENGVPEEALVRHLRVSNVEWVAIYTAILPFLSVNGGYLAMDDVNMSAAAEKHYGIQALRRKRSLVNRLVKVLDRDVRRMKKNADIRRYEQDGVLEWLLMKAVTFLASSFGGHMDFNAWEGERCIKNKSSILGLHFNAGRYRACMECLKTSTVMAFGSEQSRFLTILGDDRNHVADLVTWRDALLSRMNLLGFSFIFIYASLLNLIPDAGKREIEKKLLLRKVGRLPFSDDDVEYLKSLLNDSQEEQDLADLLDREDLEPVLPKILGKIITLFYTVSRSELAACARKAEEHAGRLDDDDSVRSIMCLIAGISNLMLGNYDEADRFMAMSLGETVSLQTGAILYDTYDLVKAVKACDEDALQRIYQKVQPYKGTGIYGLEAVYYRAMFVENSSVLDSKEMDALIEEFAEMARKYSSDVDSLFNEGMLFYNIEHYNVAASLFEKAAQRCGDSRLNLRVGSLRQMARSLRKLRASEMAVEALSEAIEIKENHPDEVRGYSLWGLYDDIEDVYRGAGRHAEALEWSRKIVDLLKKDGDASDLAGAYNVLGINAHSMLRKEGVPQDEKEMYFLESYKAYKKAEKLCGGGESRVLVTNRASLVFEAVGIVEDIAGKYVDESIHVLEKLLLQPDDKGHRFEHIRTTLADGYRLTGDWAGIKRLRDEFGLSNALTFSCRYRIDYYGSADKDEAVSEIADHLANEIDRGALSLYDPVSGRIRHAPHGCEEVKEMGIVGSLVSDMYAKASSGRSDALVYASAIRELGEEAGDEAVVQQGYDLMCRILMADPDSFRYFDRLPGKDRLNAMLFERGWTQDDLCDKTARESVRRICQDGSYADVCSAFSDIFRSTDVPGFLAELFDGVLESEDYNASWACLNNIRDNIDKISECFTACDEASAERLKERMEKLVRFCQGTVTEINAEEIDALFEVCQRLALEYDPMLLWMKMEERMDANDESAAMDLWESRPGCHADVWCQSAYVKALRLLGRYDEAEQAAGSFIAGSESEEASLPLVQEMMFILRNTGRYEEAYGMVERYGSVSADWDFSWMKEILSAYTGKPAQALLMCEKKWDGTDACIYAKALYLLKMGLYDDAMAAASEGSVGDDDEDVHWIYVLYLIELARYWKNADDETKATEAYAQARKYMDKVHMGMCEYEASGLGLEI